jgi:hypothetical protein
MSIMIMIVIRAGNIALWTGTGGNGCVRPQLAGPQEASDTTGRACGNSTGGSDTIQFPFVVDVGRITTDVT